MERKPININDIKEVLREMDGYTQCRMEGLYDVIVTFSKNNLWIYNELITSGFKLEVLSKNKYRVFL